MKLNGISGTGTGKMGSMVFASVSGKQIVRQYQPNVANPSTTGQVEQRAKLKLMSQVAAAVAPVIVFTKEGLVSARNKFIKKNFASVSFAANKASVDAIALQLTPGSTPMTAITATTTGNAGQASATISWADSLPADVNKLAVAVFRKDANEQLYLVDSEVFDAEIAALQGSVMMTKQIFTVGDYFYIYGVKELNASASAKFADYQVKTATHIAELVATRTLDSTEVGFTKTAGAVSVAGQ